MKALFITIFIILLSVSIGFSLMVYNAASEPLEDRKLMAQDIALEETDITEIRNIDYFHGRRSFFVIDGMNIDGQEMYVWVEEIEEPQDLIDTSVFDDEGDAGIEVETGNENDSGTELEYNDNEISDSNEENQEEEKEPQIITRLKSEGLSKEQVRTIIEDRLEIKELKSIRLGIIGSTPVYEIIYEDNDDRHSFYYMTFKDGTYIRHYQFRK